MAAGVLAHDEGTVRIGWMEMKGTNMEKKTYCGADCSRCGLHGRCGGCMATGGRPFGGECLAAEYIKVGGVEYFEEYKRQLIREINDLQVEGMPKVDKLYCLSGGFVNLAYPLPSGESVKFLDDKKIYLGTQLECEFNEDDSQLCFGVVAGREFILVCRYGENGVNAEILLYKTR